MTEAPRAEAAAAADASPWGRVRRHWRRRRSFRWALCVLALSYGLAIYAPLLAGDRPYLLEAVDRGGYARALRLLAPVASSVQRLLERGPELHARGGSGLDWDAALEAELQAARRSVDTLRASLDAAHHGRPAAWLASLEAAAAAGRAGEDARARGTAAAAVAGARALAAEYRAAPSGTEAEGVGSAGLRLRARTSYPLLASLSGLEAFFMVLWPLLCLGRPRTRTRLAGALGLAALAGVLWGALVSRPEAFETAPYKEALSRGELVATRAWFPPLAFGFAESHGSELFRAPTWTSRGRARARPGAADAGEDDAARLGEAPPQATRVPVEPRYGEPAAGSAWRHPLGTDGIGRDLLVRMLYGARVSLSVGLVSALLLVLVGTLVGACAGYFGGRVDLLLSRLMEVVLCFPAFFLILMVVAFTDPEVLPPILAIVVVIALVRWTGVARLTRAEFLRLRETEFALAARATGVSVPRTILRHLLPNALGPILVAGAFAVASGILTESALSFLGFGVAEPIPSWGSLVSESRSAEHWWIQVFPGLAIFVTVVSYNLVGEGLRDAIDPRMKL